MKRLYKNENKDTEAENILTQRSKFIIRMDKSIRKKL